MNNLNNLNNLNKDEFEFDFALCHGYNYFTDNDTEPNNKQYLYSG